MAPIAQAPRRYFIEFNGAILLYLAAVLGRVYAIRYVDEPTLRTLIILSPIVPVFLAAFAALRFYRRIDEYHRLQILESLAIAAGATTFVRPALCKEWPKAPRSAEWEEAGAFEAGERWDPCSRVEASLLPPTSLRTRSAMS